MARSTRAFRASAIQRVHDGEDQVAVARELGIPRATLRTWVHRAKLQKADRLEWVRTARQRHAGERLDALTYWLRFPSWAAAVVADKRARRILNEALCEFDEASPGEF